MRKLLQSKTAVACLCVAAVICVTGSFVDLTSAKKSTVAARGTSPAEAAVEPETLDVPAAPQLLSRWKDWRQSLTNRSLRADPFAFPVVVGATPAATAGAAPNPPAFRLQAISIEPGRALAVLNHRVVGVGDALQDYVVEEIHPAEIWMKGERGRISIPLHPPPAGSNKPTTATSRPADLPGGTPAASVRESAP